MIRANYKVLSLSIYNSIQNIRQRKWCIHSTAVFAVGGGTWYIVLCSHKCSLFFSVPETFSPSSLSLVWTNLDKTYSLGCSPPLAACLATRMFWRPCYRRGRGHRAPPGGWPGDTCQSREARAAHDWSLGAGWWLDGSTWSNVLTFSKFCGHLHS